MRFSLSLAVLISVAVYMEGAARGAVPEAVKSRPSLQKIHPGLRVPGMTASVLIRLEDPPLVARLGRNARQLGYALTRQQQLDYARELRSKQAAVVGRIRAAGGQVAGCLTASQNAVLAVIGTEHLLPIAELGNVTTVEPVIDSELQLTSTVPQVGAAALHAAGITGDGVRVAVLDSGVDYTHRNLGGAGTLEAYAAAYGSDPSDPRNTTRDGLFPTDKVIGGWDFVGETWPDGEVAPDEDPIDFGAHGTHVADILAGASSDGAHQGVAPGAKLFAFKVCSAVSSRCNGLAILRGLDACLHPNSPEISLGLEEDDLITGIVEDPVDVINLSLGSGYGQMQDRTAYVVQLFTEFGIVVAAAAGNDGDRPYIVSSPGIAPGALAVAETQVPGAKAYSIKTTVANNRGAATTLQTILNTADIAWAPIDREVRASAVVVGRGCPGDAYLAPEASLAGKVAVIDRGACAVSEKIDRAARLGAVGVVLVNNQPGDPPTFSQGAGSLFVPTLVVTQTEGNTLKSLVARSPRSQTAFGPSQFTSLAGSMASTSARGPSSPFVSIKPEIGAPGAAVSAVAGTGTGEAGFGGTSGATPVIAGAAALLQSASLLQSQLLLTPWAVKALLMNNAESDVTLNPAALPGVLAPVTRVGAGEVRVDRALAATAFAVVVEPPLEPGAPPDIQAALSFGYQGVLGDAALSLTKQVVVVNLTAQPRTFTLSRAFRYPDDAASGAVDVQFSAPTLDVPSEGQAEFTVILTVNPARLPDWTLNGGTEGGNGTLLRLAEYDGLIQVADAADRLTLPWHLLPRKSSDLAVSAESVEPGESLQLSNAKGAVAGTSETFALGGVSPVDYLKPDPFGIDIALPDLKAAGIRAVAGNLEIGVAFHHDWSHPIAPFGAVAFLDLDLDGWEDVAVLTTDYSGVGTAEAVVVDLATDDTLGVFPVDADLNASAMILRVPLALLGLTASSTVDWAVLAWDNYFTGEFTDIIYDEDFFFLRHTLDQPKYVLSGGPTQSVAPGGSLALSVSEQVGGWAASPSQRGFLLIHRLALPDRWTDVITVGSALALE